MKQGELHSVRAIQKHNKGLRMEGCFNKKTALIKQGKKKMITKRTCKREDPNACKRGPANQENAEDTGQK